MSDDLQHATRAKNHFELFGLPVRYQLDRQVLSARYLELTRATHPDFAGTDAEAQLQAMELSAGVNEAHAVLDDDLRRAEYVLQLLGGSAGDKISPDLLEQIFEMREMLSLALSSGNRTRAAAIRAQAADWLGQVVGEAGMSLDSGDTGQETQQLLAAARYIRKITMT